MGRLFNRTSGQSWHLTGEQIVGRGSDSGLLINAPHVSAGHADLRWSDGGWQVKDLGSLNGTFVNGEPSAPGVWQRIKRGDQLSFGTLANDWELAEDDAPDALILPLDGGPPFPVVGGMIAIPSEAPEVTIWEDEQGAWWLEPTDQPAYQLQERQSFDAGGRGYRFSYQGRPSTTQLIKEQHDVNTARLHIRHSPDEEYIEAFADVAGTTVQLGDRQHHFLMLTLARLRLQDRAQGIPEASCGWVYLEDLTDLLKTDRSQLNLHVYRIRKQFQVASFRDPASVIERRVQTKQLRLGVKEIVVTPL